VTQRHRLSLFADYSQFYIEDEQANPTADEVGHSWTEETTADQIAPGRGFIRFGTVRSTNVPVEIVVEESEPPLDLDAYDHVAEASIAVDSGRLIVAGNSDAWEDAARLTLEPDTYRARALYRGLGTLSADGLDGDDHYTVVLWPAPAAPRRVLKRYQA